MNPIAKIDLTFNQDWSKFYNIRQTFLDKIQKNQNFIKQQTTWSEFRYDFGSLGSLTFFNTVTDTERTADGISGNILKSSIPWYSDFSHDLGIQPTSVSFLTISDNILPHCDRWDGIESHCKLNYILDDCDCTTYAFNEDTRKIENYPSVAGTAYLLDTTKLHWVNYNGNSTRSIFQIVFHRRFSEVLHYLTQLKKNTYS